MNYRMLRPLRSSRYMTLGLILSGMILLLWYLSTIVLAAEAIGADESWSSQGIPRWILDSIVAAGAYIGGWKLWATISILLPVLHAEEIARLASFAKRYLEDEQAGKEIGLRSRIRKRVESCVCALTKHGYKDIVIAAHSFGTVIATDIFAQRRKPPHGQRVRLVTWGSPIAILQHRSRWLREELDAFTSVADLEQWDDVYSKNDWLCAAHPAREASPLPGGGHLIEFDVSLWRRWSGRSHLEYFTHPKALALLLPQGGARVAAPDSATLG
ncbi:MAG: hypothetical protein JNM84_11035 [Planctomycetes bacterium]|nr:hypothetical protein [Planctomycetota bacterium]